MPYKKGPHGTKRYYNSSNGKYASTGTTQKRALTKKERKLRRLDSIKKRCIEKAYNKNDKYLADVVNALVKLDEYCLRMVNDFVKDTKTGLPREIDIMTTKLLIEVKSGACKKKIGQFLAQQLVANKRKLKYIVYAPEMKIGIEKECNRNGIKVVRKIEEILKEQGKK